MLQNGRPVSWLPRSGTTCRAATLLFRFNIQHTFAPRVMTWTDFELAYLPAHRQLELFRTRQLSPVDVLEAQIGRIEALNPQVNALTYQHFETALDAARESERRYQRRDFRALEGVTVAVKDEYDRVGWHVTAGSVLLKDEVSPDTHPVIDKLLAAGALLHVQTTAPEFYLVAVTWSDLWGSPAIPGISTARRADHPVAPPRRLPGEWRRLPS